MNFPLVFRWLIYTFRREKIDFALIGGFGLQASGVVRTTRDIDFLISGEAVAKVKKLMTGHGYKLIHGSNDVSNYVGTKLDLGRVDFLHARRSYTCAMLERATVKKVLDGQFELKVLKPEDLIGLKVQAFCNDPTRYHQEMSDIEALLIQNRSMIDMRSVGEYFKLFNREKDLDDIVRRIVDVKHSRKKGNA